MEAGGREIDRERESEREASRVRREREKHTGMEEDTERE